MHHVVARAQLGDEPGQLAEVVAVVGVAHEHVRAARRLDAAHQGAAVAALPQRAPRARPAIAASSGEPSVLPLSATTISPAMPAASQRPRAPW